MVDLVLAVVLLAIAGSAGWMIRDLRTLRAGPARPTPVSGSIPGPVSVVVPARDEEATLPALLDSLRGFAVDVVEVVVVDDGSRDATASVARSAGAVVVPAADRPPGWTGKAWACHLGAGATTGDLLLFLDADTTLAPDALERLVALQRRHGGLVSVQPFHDAVRPYEQLSAYFNAIAVLASGAFASTDARRAMAFGPCLLTSRVDYERAGGHGAARAEILDDVSLAAAYHRAGLPVVCAVGGDAVRMRSYPGGVRQLVAGWTKNIVSGASAAAPGPRAIAVLWVCAHHAVAVGALLAIVQSVFGRTLPLAAGSLALWAIAWLGLAAQLRWVLRRLGSFRWWTWALFPVPLLAFDLIFARSAVWTVVRRSVRWRGRDVEVPGRGSAGEGV
jgi:4,4'-diaponeurosporenoate glycosyltransferase